MTSEQFEIAVIEACKENLRDDIDPYHYADTSLNEMYGSDGYEEMYFEISALHTKSGNPVVVSL